MLATLLLSVALGHVRPAKPMVIGPRRATTTKPTYRFVSHEPGIARSVVREPRGTAEGAGSLWVVDQAASVSRVTSRAAFRASSPRAQEILRLPGHPSIVAAFAGEAILWSGSTAGPPALYRLDHGVSRLLWRGRDVALPAAEPPGSHVVQGIGALGASASAAGFVYGATVALPPGCDFCSRPVFREVWVGPPQGPFRRVRGLPSRCHQIDALDAGPTAVVVSESPTTCSEAAPTSARVVSVPIRGRGRRVVLAASNAFRFTGVAAAGRYVAWNRVPPHCGRRRIACWRAGVVVFDRRTSRVVLKLHAKQLHVTGGPSISSALQADGKLALVAFGATKPCEGIVCNHGRLAWASPSSPRPHLVAAAPRDWPIAMSDDRIVFPTEDNGALEVSDLRGRARTLDRFVPSVRWFPGTLDASGGRALWVVATPAPSTSILAARLR